MQLAAQIAKLLADPATRDKLTTLALEPLPGSTPDSFAAYIKSEVDRWAGSSRIPAPSWNDARCAR